MKDLLIPKNGEGSLESRGSAFTAVVFDGGTKTYENCCKTAKNLVNCGKFDDPQDITPEEVIFSPTSGCATNNIVQYIKNESRDYYKGTSFRWAGEWESGKLYSGDEYYVDFVSYEGALWVCVHTHFGTTAPDKSPKHWEKALSLNNVELEGIDGGVVTFKDEYDENTT